MKTPWIVAAVLTSILASGCVQASPSKTPSQRAVERGDLDNAPGGGAVVPPAIRR